MSLMSIDSSGAETIRVYLAACATAAGARRRRTVSLCLPGEGGGGGVDLRMVGRELGLDPATVRLNGYYLSRGPGLVSAVTWDSLLSFFASRGLAVGGSDGDPVQVQGNPLDPSGLHCPSEWQGNSCLFSKRKSRLEDENPLKKNRVTECQSGLLDVGHRSVISNDSLPLKRRSELEDGEPLKKQKIAVKCNSRTMNSSSEQVIVNCRLHIKRVLESEDGESLKKQKIIDCNSRTASSGDQKASNGNSASFKKRPAVVDDNILKKKKNTKCDSGVINFSNGCESCKKNKLELDDNKPYKKQRLNKCKIGSVNEACVLSSLEPGNESTYSCTDGGRAMCTIYLSFFVANGEQNLITYKVACHEGVDFGSIGRVLRLDPTSVRLNGYFLGRGSNLISSLTWGALLSFFAARGFTVGGSKSNPIIVKGKPLRNPDTESFSDAGKDGGSDSLRRKCGIEDEISYEKKRLKECNSAKKQVPDRQIDAHSLQTKRPSLEEYLPSKKLKTTESRRPEYISGLIGDGSALPMRNGFGPNCLNIQGKALTPLVCSSRRIR